MHGCQSASVFHRIATPRTGHYNRSQPITADALTKTLLSHISGGRLQKAITILFSSPCPISCALYEHLFKLCSSNLAIVEARKVESHLVTYNPTPPVFLLNRAIETYAKCGSLEDARQMFEEIPHRDGGSWNAIITAYNQGGKADDTLGMFLAMRKAGVLPNEITFASVLSSCGVLLAQCLSRQVHVLVLKYGFCGNMILCTSLVDVYGKCRAMTDARLMFDQIENPNSVSWNVIVRRYLEMGNEKESVFMFFKMLRDDVRPLSSTFSNALKSCSRVLALNEGKQTHGVIIKVNFDNEEVVSSSLTDMYAKCGKLEEAHRIFDQTNPKNLISGTSVIFGYTLSGRTREARKFFDEMPERNVITWNTMLAGYTDFLQWEEALNFVSLMLRTSKEVDYNTIGLILKICAGLSDVDMGKQVHGYIYRHDFYSNTSIGNALIDMYGKCGNLKRAGLWFSQMKQLRDKVSWNSLMTSYARHGLVEQAMTVFSKMHFEAKPSKYTFGTLLTTCVNISAIKRGKQIHGFMIRNNYEMDLVVLGSLVDMYSKCRYLGYAIAVFKESQTRDIILWNSMLFGFCFNGRGRDALELIRDMEIEGIKPDHLTFHAILLACVYEGDVKLGGKYFDSMSSKYFIIPRVEHYECMIELYCRYGREDKLESFVKSMKFEPTSTMLTRVIDACQEHGYSRLREWAAARLNEWSPAIT